MSKRYNVVEGKTAETLKSGLTYTRRCGWIDLGHANPSGSHGPAVLWHKILTEASAQPCEKGFFIVEHTMSMSLVLKKRRILTSSTSRRYQIRKGMPLHMKKAAALSVFLDVSYEFEGQQASIPYRWFTDSGFSAEDLVSNLVGFYRAVEPGPKYVQMCDPVSLAQALAVWDRYGPVGSNKNYHVGPYLYPIDGDSTSGAGPRCAELPHFLRKISPMPAGKDLVHCFLSDFNKFSCPRN